MKIDMPWPRVPRRPSQGSLHASPDRHLDYLTATTTSRVVGQPPADRATDLDVVRPLADRGSGGWVSGKPSQRDVALIVTDQLVTRVVARPVLDDGQRCVVDFLAPHRSRLRFGL